MKRILSIAFFALITASVSSQTYTPIPLMGQTSTFTGNTRGYWFIAPTCFTITAAMVPTDASTGSQNIAILRLETNPPLFSTTTNNFDVLYLTQNNSDPDTIGLNIIVNQGDVIGILASRNTINSYGSGAPYASNINGIPVTINRFGMQYPLNTTLPQNVWTEASGSISRMNLYYDTIMHYNITNSNIGLSYTFSDGTDTLYTSLFSVWDYGDGSPLDTNYNPTHNYSSAGSYNVCSYIHTNCGIDTICSTLNICSSGPIAGFTSATSGYDALFSDASSGTFTWSWDFGDGNTSTLQNPSHTYASAGWYYVTQIVANSCGPNDTIMDSVLVCDPLSIGAFSAMNTSATSVDFTDGSSNATSWSWDFGDGNNGNTQNPTHNYASMGWYYVTEIISNSCGVSDTIMDSVLVCSPPTAGTFMPLFLNTNSATFLDASVDATSWNWDFGDGNTSTTQNPSTNYLANGTYNVCLIVQNLCGADTSCMLVIACPSDPAASFTSSNIVFDANFTNSSTFSTSYLWDFGDGNTSTSSNPSHTYATAGTYFVCLTSFDDCNDSTTFCDSVTIAGNAGLETIANVQSMSSYPNPTNGSANITLNSPENIKGKLFVTDITGKVVSIIHTGLFIAGPTQFLINTNIWTNGIYLLVWETEKWKVSKKLLVN